MCYLPRLREAVKLPAWQDWVRVRVKVRVGASCREEVKLLADRDWLFVEKLQVHIRWERCMMRTGR